MMGRLCLSAGLESVYKQMSLISPRACVGMTQVNSGVIAAVGREHSAALGLRSATDLETIGAVGQSSSECPP